MYARRAIEGLRSGVPNAPAVDALGIEQPGIMRAFEQRLEALIRHDGVPIPGFVIEGDFGTGKSHILRYLEQASLKRKIATSSVTISKETPLGDLSAVFRNAILSLTYPDERIGGTLGAIFERLDTNSERYVDFYKTICSDGSGLDSLFQASVLLYDSYSGNPEIVEQLVLFWDGGPPQVPLWRALLKDVEAAPRIRSVALSDLAMQRFRFAALALRAANFAGWLLTIDEMELIAKLSLPARTKAYVATDRLFSFRTGSDNRGLTDTIVVGAITTDLIGELLNTRDERTYLPRQARINEETASAALSGLDSLASSNWRHMIRNDVELSETWCVLRALYHAAYKSEITDPSVLGEYNDDMARRNMRQNIRSWIWSWDLARLDPTYSSNIVADEVSYDLTEDEDIDVPERETSFESAV